MNKKDGCFIYRNFHFGDVFSDHLSCVREFGRISFSLPNDPSVERIYFPVGSSVNSEFKKYEGIEEESLENKSFQWSIKKIGDDAELADQSHTSPQLTHTFSEAGVYNISIEETSKDNSSRFAFSDKRELLIGLCEKEAEAVEVVLSQESFGNLTPKEILKITQPIFNYVRPSDTDSNNKVTTILDDVQGRPHPIYKYKRSSSSKFIDIDIQNADECFFDDDPIQTECNNSRRCPTEQPNCDNVHCDYEIRENLSPLSSCSGNVLDMSTIDTDTTECTDDIFVVAASNNGWEIQQTFYKHCPADQDYCYFGRFGSGYRFSHYKYPKCPSS